MKNPVFLLFTSLVILFSCSKDVVNDEGVNLKLANVPVPMKGEVCMANNFDIPKMPVEGTPVGPIPALEMSGSAWLSGQMTHMGELQDQSSMTGVNAYLDMVSLSMGKVVLVAVYTAILIGDNGDYFTLLAHIRIDVTDQTNKIISGDWTITGGSGKFENAEGGGILNGILPCWYIDGMISYSR
jgi:hypothetical protein